MAAQERDISTSLLRALDVISLLTAAPQGRSLADLAELTAMPRTTVRRILTTLERYGVVDRNGTDFDLSESFFHWANRDRYAEVRRRYRPILTAIAQKAGELVLLGVQEGDALVHVDFIEADHAVRVAPMPTTRHDLHKTAQGKIVLSRRPDLAARFRKRGLAQEIEEIHRTGIAWNIEESDPGMAAVAFPGFGNSPVDPVIGIAWPIQRFSRQEAERLVRAARRLIQQAEKPDGGIATNPAAGART